MGRPARDNTSVLDTLPFQVVARLQRMFLRWKVLSILSCLAYVARSVQQCDDDTDVVDCHLCFHCQLVVYPHSSREAGESCSCLPDPLVDLCVQREVVGDGRANVRKLVDGVDS